MSKFDIAIAVIVALALIALLAFLLLVLSQQ